MTPLEKLDNVLEQRYNLNFVKYNIGIDNYMALLEIMGYESYSLVNQAADLVNSVEKHEITPTSAVKNALMQGITSDKVNECSNVELLEENSKHLDEEEKNK